MDIARFQEMYKSRGFGALAQSASVSQRVENLNKQRQSSRNIVMMQKRKIDEGTLTPIASPLVTNQNTRKQAQVAAEGNKTDHRLEMLKKWQEDKKKRLEKQKVNKKPLFKVQHIATSSQYDLEKVYGQIKGKAIVTSAKKKKTSQEQPRLAPSSTYKFKPPANIKPINLKIGGTAASSSSNNVPKLKAQPVPNIRVTRSQKPVTSPPVLQLPVRTRQRLNFQSVEASKNSPLKKKAPVKTTIGNVATTEYAEPSTSKSLQQKTTKGKIKKGTIKAVPVTSEKKLVKSVTDLACPLENEAPPIFNTYKSQKRRSRSVGTLIDDAQNRVTYKKTPNPRRRPITQQNCIDLTSPIVQNENVQGNKKTESVPDSTDDDEEVFLPNAVKAQENGESEKNRRRKSMIVTLSSASSSLSSDYPITNEVNTTSSGSTSSSIQPVTPLNKSCASTAIYISPFVTMSRGKENARKEFHRRSLRGGSDTEKSTSPKAAAAYFYKLLKTQTDRLQMMCHEWNLYKDEQTPVEEICDMINVTVGQTDLLLNKKFQQFRGLVESCETGNSEKPITCLDLHGFWDMVMIQVENLEKRFKNLEKLKENGWEEILPIIKPKPKSKPKKKAVKKSSTSSTSSLRAAIQEARRKKAIEPQPPANEEELCIPSTSTKTPQFTKTRRSKRSSLRVLTMNSEAERSIGSPGLTMMKVTQAAKSAEKSRTVTPQNSQRINSPKSILKSQRAKSAARKSKVVLFKDNETSMDNDENQENDQNSPNLISFSPPGKTKRRSMRLAKS